MELVAGGDGVRWFCLRLGDGCLRTGFLRFIAWRVVVMSRNMIDDRYEDDYYEMPGVFFFFFFFFFFPSSFCICIFVGFRGVSKVDG